MASSTIFSLTSRHNKAPDASASVNPTCRPALSQSSCKGRGANRSRALNTSFIFTFFYAFVIVLGIQYAVFSLQRYVFFVKPQRNTSFF